MTTVNIDWTVAAGRNAEVGDVDRGQYFYAESVGIGGPPGVYLKVHGRVAYLGDGQTWDAKDCPIRGYRPIKDLQIIVNKFA